MNTWVLLRGLVREKRHWGTFPGMLANHCPGANVVAIDTPGNGERYLQRSPTTISGMTEYCRAELQGLGYRPPYHLIAVSLGGMIVSDWIARYPQEIARAVLINTSLRPLSPFYRRLRPQNYPDILRLLFTKSIAFREKTILRMTSKGSHQPILADWIRYQMEYPVSRANALRQIFAAMRFRAPENCRHVPVLILSSVQDRLVHRDCSARIAHVWQCDLHRHIDAGHDLPLDDPRWVLDTIGEWIANDTGDNYSTLQNSCEFS